LRTLTGNTEKSAMSFEELMAWMGEGEEVVAIAA